MNLETAITHLQARVDGEFSIKGVDNCDDMKLAIEALKRLVENRNIRLRFGTNFLPSETLD